MGIDKRLIYTDYKGKTFFARLQISLISIVDLFTNNKLVYEKIFFLLRNLLIDPVTGSYGVKATSYGVTFRYPVSSQVKGGFKLIDFLF